MSSNSRRARRRAKARLRDLTQHGTADRELAPRPTAAVPKAFHVMLPERVHMPRGSVTHRSYLVLQRIDAGRPKGKRRIRYTTTVEWRGQRVAGPGTRDPKE